MDKKNVKTMNYKAEIRTINSSGKHHKSQGEQDLVEIINVSGFDITNQDLHQSEQLIDKGKLPIVHIKQIKQQSSFEELRQQYRSQIEKYCLCELKILQQKDDSKKNRKEKLKLPSIIQLKAHIKEIQGEIFKTKNILSLYQTKQYKIQLRSLLYNLRDPQNCELRQKIIFKVLSPNQIASFSQIDFLSPKKRETRVDRNMMFFKAWEKQIDPIAEITEDFASDTDWESKSLNTEDEVYNRDTLIEISYFLSNKIIQKMKERLQEIQIEKIKQKTIKNLQEVLRY